MLASELESEVVALEIGGQFLFDMADHRDFLGAIVNLGVTRDGVSVFFFFFDFLYFPSRRALVLVCRFSVLSFCRPRRTFLFLLAVVCVCLLSLFFGFFCPRGFSV